MSVEDNSFVDIHYHQEAVIMGRMWGFLFGLIAGSIGTFLYITWPVIPK